MAVPSLLGEAARAGLGVSGEVCSPGRERARGETVNLGCEDSRDSSGDPQAGWRVTGSREAGVIWEEAEGEAGREAAQGVARAGEEEAPKYLCGGTSWRQTD